MGAAVAVEVPAVETRERLAAFVDEVVSALPHVRQRENLPKHGFIRTIAMTEPVRQRLFNSTANQSSSSPP